MSAVQALIFGDFVGTLVRCFVLVLVCLAVFLGSFLLTLVPIHCRLRHIGWVKCGHGLNSTPRESEGFFNELLVLFALLLRCRAGSCPFVTVLVVLLVGFPLGDFVLVVMFMVLLLNLLVLVRFRVLGFLA